MKQSQPRKPDADEARDPARVMAAALRLLARREHSVQELTGKLLQRGFEEQTVASVTAALAERELLSDERFVDEFVASRMRRGSGPLKIRGELHNRGVDQSMVDSALDASRKQWLANAEAVRRKRFGAEPPRDFAERARQARFLQQRGFSAEQIRQVLKGEVESGD
ncbi:MAG: regulatory protein RecX [Gammaproteobacteria bacterium]|nr:regulatory protein RecX [Gammaproteobacteria bacterium]MDE2346447.1 regulatory protein RecX [Gammaproteobacteria bacterium]